MSALIVSRPGPLREGLRAALATLPHLEYLSEADSAASAIGLMLEHDPTLVLLCTDGSADKSITGFGRIKARWPKVHFIILVDTVAQQQAARAAGFEEVLVKGVRPDRLLGTIEDLIRGENQTSAP